MKTPVLLFALCGLEQIAAHNVFSRLLVNQTDTGKFTYVREVVRHPYYLNDPPHVHWGLIIPHHDVHSPDATCGRSAIQFANKTGVADVLAGSEVGIRVATLEDLKMHGEPRNFGYDTFYHRGPGFAYLSRAPNNDVRSYSGDGDWFKIEYTAPVTNYSWPIFGKTEHNFTIPLTTPPGQYLLRFELLMPNDLIEQPQFFVNCAQINIIGPGGGKPTQFAKFPGTYQFTDPGIHIPQNQLANGYYPNDEMRLDQYQPPGPPVWTG